MGVGNNLGSDCAGYRRRFGFVYNIVDRVGVL